jgi:hypothetical protein
MGIEHCWNDDDGGKPKCSEKEAGSSTTLHNTNPSWASFGPNPGFRAERSATNSLEARCGPSPCRCHVWKR